MANTSSCCSEKPCSPQRAALVCPLSGTAGKPVKLLTVKALLMEAALSRITASQHGFCAEPACDIVYFAVDGATYSKGDLRVPVWQKEPFGRRAVCYCFGETEADMRREIRTSGRAHALERVRAHIAAGRCACEVRNPRGACCLGDLGNAVKRVSAAATTEISR